MGLRGWIMGDSRWKVWEKRSTTKNCDFMLEHGQFPISGPTDPLSPSKSARKSNTSFSTFIHFRRGAGALPPLKVYKSVSTSADWARMICLWIFFFLFIELPKPAASETLVGLKSAQITTYLHWPEQFFFIQINYVGKIFIFW